MAMTRCLLLFFPAILDDLEIDVRPGSFLAEEHGGLRAVLRIATMIISVSLAYCQYIITLCGTMHIAPKPFFFHQITTYDRKIPSTVEDGSEAIRKRFFVFRGLSCGGAVVELGLALESQPLLVKLERRG